LETILPTYSPEQKNILVVGPVAGNEYNEMVIPVLSPDPSTNKKINYLKYPIYLGGNRAVDNFTQIKSNNNIYNSSVSGTITSIVQAKKSTTISILMANGETVTEKSTHSDSVIHSQPKPAFLYQKLKLKLYYKTLRVFKV
jgi:apocytochrome f